ncbi:TetR/AcrR family transcriptional regulator [Clostridium sp. KNHs205]|uniref:TetR/AcrR family transcriptional regulator n=1 Tax=Clostridium sp. KNHs205 TaxID=1449050 RepID=UPI00051B9A6F|nr:TetR/AcrR family transcriptional regulator [Clostridium sp. KNHs205]
MSEQISTKEKIVNAAWELFHIKSYEDTTVEDIIAAAGTSKGTFYYYFERKDSLLDTLATIFDRRYEQLEKEMSADLSSYDKLLFMNYEMHQFIEKNIDVDLLSSLYSTQLISKGQSNLLDQNRMYYKLVTDIMEEGQKLGQITKDKSVRELTKYYSLCERALISDWCLSKGSYSLTQYSKDFLPFMLETIRADK